MTTLAPSATRKKPRFDNGPFLKSLIGVVGLGLTCGALTGSISFVNQILFSVGLGTAMSGLLAGYYDADREVAYFGILGLIAVVVGAVVFAIAPWISRQMEGVH